MNAYDVAQYALAIAMMTWGLHLIGVTSVAVGAVPVAIAQGTGSMEPAIDGGDRLVHDYSTGDVDRGDVVIFRSDGREEERVAHRARLYVEAGENWYDDANEQYVDGAENCEELANCPAPNAGWITRGDNNTRYDQTVEGVPPVKEKWIVGRVISVVKPESFPF